MYFCLLFLSACAIQLVAGVSHGTECNVQGKVVQPGKPVKAMSTCTKYRCHTETATGLPKRYILDQELLTECVGVKCTKKDQIFPRTYADKRLEITCNGQLQPIVSSAECLIGGSRLEHGQSFQDYTTCTSYFCSVTNIGQEISKVKFEEHRERIKDCNV